MARRPTGTAGAGDDSEHEHVVDEEWEAAALRRAPRHGRILLMSVVAGLVVAGIHTAVSSLQASPGDPMTSQASGVVWTYGVLAVIWVAFALLVAATAVIVLDKLSARRIRPVVTERSTTITDDLVSPVKDEVPWWVRDAEEDARTRRDLPPRPEPKD